jgi:hypothetical protein
MSETHRRYQDNHECHIAYAVQGRRAAELSARVNRRREDFHYLVAPCGQPVFKGEVAAGVTTVAICSGRVVA